MPVDKGYHMPSQLGTRPRRNWFEFPPIQRENIHIPEAKLTMISQYHATVLITTAL